MVGFLTEQDIQEGISYAYLKAICNYAGHDLSEPNKDYGIDTTIRFIEQKISGKPLPSCLGLDVQLKSTTNFEIRDNKIIYPLRNKNYRDLVINTEMGFKRILILLLLPKNKKDWLNQTEEQLIIKKCAYWVSLEGLNEPSGQDDSTTNIEIPLNNIFSEGTLNNLIYPKIKAGERLNE